MNRFIPIAAPPEAPSGARRGVAVLWAALLYAYPLLLALAAWELAGWADLVRPLFLPRMSSVAAQFWVLLKEGEIIEPLVVSLYRTFLGLAISVVVGVMAGLLMARSQWAHWFLDPLISVGFPAPKIAFVPIFTLWFGIDHLSKILLVAFNCIFPMIVATYHGAAAVSRTVVWSAQTMGTSERQLLYRIVLPAALPHILSGVRVTVPVALIITFTTEMIAGGGGVGAALMFAQRFFQTPTVFVYILVMLATGVIFDHAMQAMRRRLIPWQEEIEDVS
jgi:ABC-type nitrate/sulfonate/bicarbonate transport system permease component